MYIKILKDKHNIDIENNDDAKKVLEALSLMEKQPMYSYNKEGEPYKFYSKIMLDKILRKMKVISTSEHENDLMVYTDGKYMKNDDISNYIRLNLLATDSKRIQNRKETLKDLAQETKIDPNSINKNKEIINFKNGLLDTKEKKIAEHSPKVRSTIQVNCNYYDYNTNGKEMEDKYKESLFKKYLETSFDPELIPLVQEIFGYCLSSYTEAQKFFVLLGEGQNGKSVLANILYSFFDSDFVSSVELKDLSRPEFAARLYNKALNICSDMSAEYIQNTSLIKGLTGEDDTGIEVKPLYANPFRMHNKAKMVFNCNSMPSTTDKTFSFIRRLIIIPCTRIIEKKNMVENLSSKILESEKELVCSWAIEGLYRLIENKFKFTETKLTKQAIEEYKNDNNSVEAFIGTYCYIDKNEKSFIPKNEFTMAYKYYCEDDNIKPLGGKNVNEIMKTKKVDEKNSTLWEGRYWQGICWKPNIIEFIKAPKGTKKFNHDIEKEKKINSGELRVIKCDDDLENIEEELIQIGMGE